MAFYVNVPSRREIAVVDADKLKVMETWPLTDASANYPMALDAARHRLLVYDTGTGKQVSTVEAGSDSDDIFYEDGGGRVYASFGEGSVFVYEHLDADRYRLAAKVPTAAGARTALFSPELGRLIPSGLEVSPDGAAREGVVRWVNVLRCPFYSCCVWRAVQV